MTTTTTTMETTKKATWLLTGDIGGTNSRMGLYETRSGAAAEVPLMTKTYRNQDMLTKASDGIFELQVVAPFLKEAWESQEASNDRPTTLEDLTIVACLAIAGPVRNNAVTISNLHNIVIDGTAIAKGTYNKGKDPFLQCIQVCKIINDFVAQGYGCLTLQKSEVKELRPNPNIPFPSMDPTGPKVCVGAGTGLGECFLTPNGDFGYECYASEGGHVEYAPRSDLEVKLWKYLKEKFDYRHRVSVERVVSGRGLANCYEFLAQEFPAQVDATIHKEFLEAEDMQGKVVADNAVDGKNALCRQAMEIMMSAYGSEVGSAAVKFIPTGGMFVTGGLTPKNIDFIEGSESPFCKAYYDKGRVTPVLHHVPLYAVMVEDLGVRGAHRCAMMEYEKLCGGSTTRTGSSSTSQVSRLLQMGFATAVGAVVGMTLVKSKK